MLISMGLKCLYITLDLHYFDENSLEMESLVINEQLSHFNDQRKGKVRKYHFPLLFEEFDWERPKVLPLAVNHATKDDLISQTSVDEVALLPILDKGWVLNE